MIPDTTLDMLLKDTIAENLVKDPGKEFTASTIKAIGNMQSASKPLLSGKVITLIFSLLTAGTIILALNPSSSTNLPTGLFRYISLSSLFNNINFQIKLDSNVLMILVSSCILLLLQLTMLKKIILK
ncbi:MAG: hypothetical protein RLY85_1808 [Bacteroidota bacterium]|jgi:hypothetical protein